MRLVGTFSEEKEAHIFCNFLSKKEAIACSYEAFEDAQTKKHEVRVWIENEEDLERASLWFERFKEKPQDFSLEEEPPLVHVPERHSTQEIPKERKRFRIKVAIKPGEHFKLTLTNIILVLCVFLFFWNGTQELKMVNEHGPLSIQLGLTPLEQGMVFDYPHAYQAMADVLFSLPLKDIQDPKDLSPKDQELLKNADSIPSWKGVYAYFLNKNSEQTSPPLFEKIKEGDYWRLISPIVMHRGFLHILFNMAWLWILGRQIEERIGKFRMLSLIIPIALVSNILQYLMSGPFFFGFSGVVIGMAGFIWMRQKIAPWEGYPLQRATLLFILIFVLAMFALEIFSFALQLFTQSELTANIANTAHIVGGLVGLSLGRFSFFARVRSHP